MLDVYNIRFGEILQGRHEGPDGLHDCGGGLEAYVLLQFTGLHDKHGKEIYEGDVLQHKLYRVLLGMSPGLWKQYVGEGKVKQDDAGEYIDSRMTVGYDDKHGHFSPFVYGHSYYTSPDALEILGNRYEHPELVSVQEAMRDG